MFKSMPGILRQLREKHEWKQSTVREAFYFHYGFPVLR